MLKPKATETILLTIHSLHIYILTQTKQQQSEEKKIDREKEYSRESFGFQICVVNGSEEELVIEESYEQREKLVFVVEESYEQRELGVAVENLKRFQMETPRFSR